MSEEKKEAIDQGQNKKTLRERDPKEWKARKVRRQSRRDSARAVAKAAGVKLGRWRGSIALAKDGAKVYVSVGSPEKIPEGYTLIEGGAK